MNRTLAFTLAAVLLAACAPEIGSQRWCDGMKAKAKGDWTVNETADFAKHCLFK